MSIQPRLAEHVSQAAAKCFGHAIDFLAYGVGVLIADGIDHDRHTGRPAILAKHFAHRFAPLARRDTGLGAGDGGLHDIGPLLRSRLQACQCRLYSCIVAVRTPGRQLTDLHHLFSRIDRLDCAVATAQGALFRFGVAVHADDSQIAGFDRLHALCMGADKAFLHEVDGVRRAAARIDFRERRPGEFFQFVRLAFDHMTAIEQIFIF